MSFDGPCFLNSDIDGPVFLQHRQRNNERKEYAMTSEMVSVEFARNGVRKQIPRKRFRMLAGRLIAIFF